MWWLNIILSRQTLLIILLSEFCEIIGELTSILSIQTLLDILLSLFCGFIQ